MSKTIDILESLEVGVVANPPAEDPWCIPNVKILGLVSKNGGRRYTEKCLKEAVSLYEGKALCNDHTNKPIPVHSQLPTRDPNDILGYFRGVRYVPGDGLRGDLHFTRRGELAESVKIASRDNPSLYGFSHHVAEGGSRSHVENGIQVVDAITSVVSIDLVTNPATTNGMFEGVVPVEPKKLPLKDYLHSLVTLPSEHKRVDAIFESLDGSMSGIEVEPGNPATPPEDKIKSGFKEMMISIVESYIGDGDDAKLVSNIKAAAKACGMMLKGDAEPKQESSEESESDDKKESVQPTALGHDGAAALLESCGVTITPKLLKSLSGQTKEQAEALLESVQAERKRADDAEKRLKTIEPKDVAKSVARTTAIKESATDKNEYKPMFMGPLVAVNN